MRCFDLLVLGIYAASCNPNVYILKVNDGIIKGWDLALGQSIKVLCCWSRTQAQRGECRRPSLLGEVLGFDGIM
jgi:hypothetical protein